MLSDSAQSLVAKAQAGDQAAFDALIAGHREGLQNLIRTRLVSSGLQNSVGEDDVYQETLLRAFQKLTAFRWQREDSFGRWLGVIATNLIRSAGKRDKRSPLPLIHDDVDANDDDWDDYLAHHQVRRPSHLRPMLPVVVISFC